MYRIGGSLRSKDVSLYGDAVGIPLLGHWISNLRPLSGRGTMSGGEFDWAVASERVSEAPKGSLRMDGNHPKSVKA